MFDFKACLSMLWTCLRKHPAAFLIILLVIVVFASAPFLWLYRKVQALPGVNTVAPVK